MLETFFFNLSSGIGRPKCLDLNWDDLRLKRDLISLEVSLGVLLLNRREDFVGLIDYPDEDIYFFRHLRITLASLHVAFPKIIRSLAKIICENLRP